MKGFFIKKAFFDGWDNLIGLVLFNIVFILLFGVLLYAMSLIEISGILALLAMSGVLLLFALVMGGTSGAIFNYSNYQRDSWSAFVKAFSRNLKHSLLFFVVSFLMIAVITYVIPFYLTAGKAVGLIIAVLLFWLEFLLFLGLPFYFPLMNLLPGDRPMKTLKKCFLIVGDNIGFALFFMLYNLIVIVLSVFTLGMIPGVGGSMLAAQDAMKLIMFKYDYLEENPDADKKHIPWADLLYDEKEKVGPRTLKNMIFPWK